MELTIIVLSVVVVALAAALLATLLSRSKQTGLSDSLKVELHNMSQVALIQNSEQFLNLADQRLKRQADAGSADLDTKKQLIDQRLEQMNLALEKVTLLVNNVEKEREAKFSELGTQLKHMSEQTMALTASTATLREALSSTRVRGQWGERMADDILQFMGLKEGVNYNKQTRIEGVGSQPDFTFYLPGGLKIHMDVKFPLDNYLKYLSTQSDLERETYRAAFLQDARNRIREITTREYIDPEGGTVDCVLLFIPNESIFSFVHEQDASLIEYGLKSRVICCSPLTLFAVLVVIRQAVESFSLQRAEEEIVSLMGSFKQEWVRFKESLDIVGKRLLSTQKAFDSVTGRRQRALERPLFLIEELRQQKQLPVADIPVSPFEGLSDEELDADSEKD